MRRLFTATPLVLTALLALALPLTSCGDEVPEAAPRAERRIRLPRRPALAPVDDADKVRFALDRLLRGPLPRTTRFAIPNLQGTNLELALGDLLALDEETLRQLGDPSLVRRLTTAPPAARNPWHAVLDVLARVESPAPELVLAWTNPALESGDVTLMRRAVEVLARAPGDAVGESLLRFLDARGADRAMGPKAMRALVARGSTWASRALRRLYRQGTGRVWGLLPGALAEADGTDDALAWWALVAETSGPRPVAMSERSLRPAWHLGMILVDEDVWPREMASLDVAVQHDRVLARPWTQDWLGMIPAPAASAPVVARGALEVDGTIPAATARCRLAVEGGTTARASVEAELRGEDRALEHVARACPLGDERALDLADARLFLDGLLGQLEQGLMPEGRMAIGALGALRDAGDEAATDYAARLLADARPQDDYQTVLFAAQDHLLEHAEDRLVAWLGDALGGEDPDEIEIALVLMRRKPIGAYVDLIERGLEQRGDDEVRDALRRLLVWVMSGAPDVSDDKRDAFATRLATWIDAMPQPRAAVLAPALLDLGAAGHAAYAEGLRGSRRVDYVQGLGHVRRIIPAVVAAALLEPVDASTPAQERQAVWIAAYRTAPAEAADALRAAGERVDPGDREEMRDVLEVVRHRAVKAAR